MGVVVSVGELTRVDVEVSLGVLVGVVDSFLSVVFEAKIVGEGVSSIVIPTSVAPSVGATATAEAA